MPGPRPPYRAAARAVLLAALLAHVAGVALPVALAQVPPETSPERPGPGTEPSPDLPLPEKGAESVTFIPLPIVYTDPNTGAGYGVMPVLLIHPQKRIEWLFAPSVDYNAVVGTAFTSRVFFYPSTREELVAFNALTTGHNMEHSLHFRGRDRFVDYSDLYARGYFIIDATKRFFGLGAETKEDDETDYELTETGVEGDFGYRFWDVLRLSGTARYRRTKVDRGDLDDLPNTVDVFPTLNGVDGDDIDVLGFGARLTLDLRDDPAIPSDGLLAEAFVEFSARGMVSDTRYERWGAHIVHHLPIVRPGRWVNVLRARYSAIDGDGKFPFWELPTLGGSENLRGFGLGRFTDTQYIVVSIEERIRFVEMIIRDNLVILEVAPWLDAGRVFGEVSTLDAHDWQFIPGAGVRLLLPDSAIVARFDLGYSFHEGPAAFVLLGYPF